MHSTPPWRHFMHVRTHVRAHVTQLRSGAQRNAVDSIIFYDVVFFKPQFVRILQRVKRRHVDVFVLEMVVQVSHGVIRVLARAIHGICRLLLVDHFDEPVHELQDGPMPAREKIAAINNQTDSKFVGENGQVIFAVLIKGFKFENQLMEDHFNENYMESTKFPKADFKGYITNIKDVNFSKDGSYPVTLDGNLTLHGVTNKVTATGTMKVAGGAPEMEGTFKIKLKDYKVEGLYIGEKIAPEVAITVKCKYQ